MIYRKLLCFMNVKEDFETGFHSDHTNFERSVQQIMYRMVGYYKNDAEQLINEFKHSEFYKSSDLNEYIKIKQSSIGWSVWQER